LIKVSPEVAFAYLSDLTRHVEWAINPGLALEQSSPGPIAPGTTFRSRGTQFGLNLEDEVTVTALEPPHRFAFEAKPQKGPLVRNGQTMMIWHAFDFHREDGGVMVTKETEIVQGPAVFRLTRPLTELVLRRRLQKDLKRIAARLESKGAQ
jgi:hypothetical protein